GLVAPGALGLGILAGGRLVYSILSMAAISPRERCHMRSSTRFRTSSLPALGCWAAGAWAGGCAGGWPGAAVWANRGSAMNGIRTILAIGGMVTQSAFGHGAGRGR